MTLANTITILQYSSACVHAYEDPDKIFLFVFGHTINKEIRKEADKRKYTAFEVYSNTNWTCVLYNRNRQKMMMTIIPVDFDL